MPVVRIEHCGGAAGQMGALRSEVSPIFKVPVLRALGPWKEQGLKLGEFSGGL